ncbi:MAG: polyprenyl synthetase family protein [Rickettsiaceae bacterium]|nr:polyprenyl synthetase family protein [Rickettsiaceae bacterium]
MQKFYDLVKAEMLLVDDFISNHIKSKQELIEIVSKYLMDSGGKRMRSALLLLCSKALNYSGDADVKLAAAIELVHAATLLHDDVVDNSAMRRFKPSAHMVWGNRTSILVGDFLFALSFRMMVDAGSSKAMQRLSKASAVMVEGEVYQMTKMKQKSMPTISEYYNIITAKTAELFSASCEIGAIISSGNDDVIAAFREFGLKLGIIFQISDDFLDYFGSDLEIGKNVGDDFIEGKVTLPIIIAYTDSSEEDKKLIEELILTKNGDISRFPEIVVLLNKYNIQEKVSNIKNELVSEAESFLRKVPIGNNYFEAMISVLNYAARRVY